MFKLFDQARDIRERTSPVNEVIFYNTRCFTGSTVDENNIRKFTHWFSATMSGGLFHTLYDIPYTTSSAAVLANVTYGQSVSSSFYANALATNKVEKLKVYRLFAKQLLGDEDSLFTVNGETQNDLVFFCVNRSQSKDEVKKQSITLRTVFSGSRAATYNSTVIGDISASVYSQDIRGDYAPLYSGSIAVGLFYYQAGVAVLAPHRFSNTSSVSTNPGNFWSGTYDYGSLVTSGNFENLLTGIRGRFLDITFTNQANLQSSYFFVRMQNDEFNYSSNPTWVDNSGRIMTTSGSTSYGPITYATKVGLLGEGNEVLAVACISQPIKKSFENEQMIVVRIDF